MNAQKMLNNDNSKSKYSHCLDLYCYINKITQSCQDETILFSGNFNIFNKSDTCIIKEMSDLAEKSKSNNPFDHFMIFYEIDEDEYINKGQLFVEIFLQELGYAGCQCCYSFHKNESSKKVHCHILINRVDSQTFTCRDNFNDISKISKAIKKFKNGETSIVKIKNNKTTKQTQPKKQIQPQPEINEKLIEILKAANTWKDVHKNLRIINFKYIRKGGGAVLVGKVDDKDYIIKGSSLFIEGSLGYMQKRLGKYVEPSGFNFVKESSPKKDDEETKYFKNVEEKIKEMNKEKKEFVQLFENGFSKDSIEFKNLYDSVKVHSKEQLDIIIDKIIDKIAKGKSPSTTTCFLDMWLNERKVINNKYCNEIINYVENRLENPTLEDIINNTENKINLFLKYHNAVQAKRYRYTLRNDNITDKNGYIILNSNIFVLNKIEKDSPSPGNLPEEIVKYLKVKGSIDDDMIRHLYYTPLPWWDKYHILVDDINKNNLDRMLNDGFNPSCIILSSPNNFQAIFTLKKLGSKNDSKIGNDIAKALNNRYGDINLSGHEHAHRLPGSYNPKKKYIVNGCSPIVRLIYTSNDECSLLKDVLPTLDKYYNFIEKEPRAIIKKNTSNLTTSYNKLYNIHLENIKKMLNVKDINYDHSVADFVIAVRLISTGHNRDEIKKILFEGSPKFKSVDGINIKRHSNFQAYVERTLDAAFGEKGQNILRKYASYVYFWKKLEGLE